MGTNTVATGVPLKSLSQKIGMATLAPSNTTVVSGWSPSGSVLTRISTPERAAASGPTTRRRSARRKTAVGALTVVVTLLATIGAAFADAADPNPDASGTATIVS